MQSVFLFGIQDAFLPYGLVTLITFYFVLSRYGKTVAALISTGVIFILTVLLIEVLCGWGVLDHMLVTKGFYNAAQWFYLFIGVLFICAGGIHFNDWWRIKTETNALRMPLFFFSAPMEMVQRAIVKTQLKDHRFWAIKTFFFAMVVGFFSAAWQEEIVFSIFADLFSSNRPMSAEYLYVYFFGQSTVLLIVLLFSLWMRRAYPNRLIVSVAKIIYAAVLIAVGVGLVYLYIKFNHSI